MSKFRHQLFSILRGRGLDPTDSKLRTAILTGRVDRPVADALGNLLFDDSRVEQFSTYLANPPRRGRKKKRDVAPATRG